MLKMYNALSLPEELAGVNALEFFPGNCWNLALDVS
jgi:hypothetical protein